MNIISQILLIKNYFLGRYSTQSFSQEGEDLILARIFEGQKSGFYVDVGAHHPLRFSNTYLLYKKGWSGINIDANPGSMDAFNIIRHRDINLELGVGGKLKQLIYYIFNESAINTFDKSLIKHNLDVGYKLIGQEKVTLLPLSKILSKYAKSKKIDLLSIDIEGFDYQALESMDWSYKPTVIVIEQLGKNMRDIINSRSSRLLNKHGYVIHSKTVNSIIYIIK